MCAFFGAVALLSGIMLSVPPTVVALPAVLCGGRCLYLHIIKFRANASGIGANASGIRTDTSGIGANASGIRTDTSDIVVQGATLSAFIIYWILRNNSDYFYLALHKSTRVFSGWIGVWVRRTVDMSVTYSGIDLVILFFIAGIATLIIYGVKKPWAYAACPACVALIWAGYIALWTYLAENTVATGLNRIEALTGPLDFRFLLFTALLAAWHVMRRIINPQAKRIPARILYISVGVTTVSIAVLLGLSLAKPAAPVYDEGRTVVFWDSGLDFSVPGEGLYGLDRVGMFGVLPQYLSGRGYRCVITQSIDARALADADALVVINPMYTPDDDEIALIWRFTEGGGGVLAVGDHTGAEQIRAPLNAILKPVGISLNFDSAIPFRTLWPDNFTCRRSPIFANVSYQQTQVVVGASLELDFGAKPLLIGRNGYSDAGDMRNQDEGFLGDMRFNRGEAVGDMILVAGAEYGDGKFLAFGDTTMFQNTVLAYSRVFVDNIFAYLTDRTGGKTSHDRNNGAASRVADEQSGAAGGMTGIRSGAADGMTGGNSGAAGGVLEPAFTNTCLIDAGHMPSFRLDKSGDSIDGFIACGLRAGIFPELYFADHITDETINRGGVAMIIISEPAKKYSADEKTTLLKFVERGGSLLLFGGYQSPAATLDIFSFFGFSFRQTPYGRVSPVQDPEMAFWNACPLLFNQSSITARGAGTGDPEGGKNIQATSASAESLLDIWGECVIARLNIGEGRIFAFADGGFLKNDNIEHIETYREGNINFIIGLLRDIADEG